MINCQNRVIPQTMVQFSYFGGSIQDDRKYQSGDSESEYDPLQDDNSEGYLIDDDNAKVIPPSCQV